MEFIYFNLSSTEYNRKNVENVIIAAKLEFEKYQLKNKQTLFYKKFKKKKEIKKNMSATGIETRSPASQSSIITTSPRLMLGNKFQYTVLVAIYF